MRRILIVLGLGCVAVFAMQWLRAPESAAVAIEAPVKSVEVARTEPELAAVEPIAVRDVSPVAEPEVTSIAPLATPTAGTNASSGLRLWGTVHRAGFSLKPIDVECRNGLDFRRSMRIDKRSQFSFEGLAPGSYWLRAGNESTGLARTRVDLQADMHVDLTLESVRTVDVRVIDEHGVAWAPPGVAIIATKSEPFGKIDWGDSTLIEAVSRPSQIRTAGVQTSFAPLKVTFRSLAFVSLVQGETVFATRILGPTDKAVDFELARDYLTKNAATVTFRVIDAVSRAPLADPSVHVFGAYVLPVQCPDGIGRVELSPGPWTLRVRSPGLVALERTFHIEPRTDLDLGEIALGGGYVVRGRIVDEHGNERRASVLYRPCDENGVAVELGTSVSSTSADGSFELRGIPPGFHLLSTWAMRREATRTDRGYTVGTDSDVDFEPAISARIVEVRDADVNGIVLTLRPGVALVVRPSGREKNGAGFRVRTTEGDPVTSSGLSPHDPVQIWLAPGLYDVETWTERDGPRQRTPIEIVRGMVVVDVR